MRRMCRRHPAGFVCGHPNPVLICCIPSVSFFVTLVVFCVCFLLNCTTRKGSSPRDELASLQGSAFSQLDIDPILLRSSFSPAEFKIVLAASSSPLVGRTEAKSHFAKPAGMDSFTKCKQTRCNDVSRNFGPHVHRGTCVRLREMEWEISESHLGPLDTHPK